MKTEHMRELLAIREQGNFSRAARSLFMTQPALSRHIADMERELGVQLLRRDRHSVEFTEAGERACASFKRCLRAYDDLLRYVGESRSGMRGELRLGVLYYTFEADMGGAIMRFSDEYPNVRVKSISCQPQDVYEALMDERIDIGVIQHADYPGGEVLRFREFVREPMEVLLPVGHPLAAKESVALADLAGEAIICLRDDPYSNMANDQALARCGFAPSRTAETDNTDTIPIAVMRGLGVYIKGCGYTIPGYEKSVVARPISDKGLTIAKAYAWRADNDNPLIPLFLEMARR